jgi:hypothetical protein
MMGGFSSSAISVARKGSGPATPVKLAAARGPEVAGPPGVPARRDEIPAAHELQHVDGHRAPYPCTRRALNGVGVPSRIKCAMSENDRSPRRRLHLGQLPCLAHGKHIRRTLQDFLEQRRKVLWTSFSRGRFDYTGARHHNVFG